MSKYELIWNTDTICIPFPLGGDPQEDIRRISTGYYLLHVGLRLDGERWPRSR